MEMKEQFINAVVRNMEPELEAKQLRKLKIVLTINLEKIRVEEECRDVSSTMKHLTLPHTSNILFQYEAPRPFAWNN
jgi:hypothetical protein